MDFKKLAAENKLLLYGLTPPKAHLPTARLAEIAAKQRQRIDELCAAGAVLYDLQDESQRTNDLRPFPFVQTVKPEVYASNYLQTSKPTVIYHSVGKETRGEFVHWLREFHGDAIVLVGSPSSEQQVPLALQEAYELKQQFAPHVPLGGVVIPERHSKKGDEHLRVWKKMQQGCAFFVSQCVYSSENTKNFLSDYHWLLRHYDKEPVPVIFTLTPCGSAQTLRFMQWLGIAIPDWIQNELLFSGSDMLDKSIEICTSIAEELILFCKEKKLPFGFNIESVSIRKEEIDASVKLVESINALLQEVASQVVVNF